MRAIRYDASSCMLKERIGRKPDDSEGNELDQADKRKLTATRAQGKEEDSHRNENSEEAIEAVIGSLSNTNKAFITNRVQGARRRLVQVA